MTTIFLPVLRVLPDYQLNVWFFMSIIFIIAIAYSFYKLFSYSTKRWKDGTEAGERPQQPFAEREQE